MSEQLLNRPMGPLQEGDQAIVDALHRIPVANEAMYRAPRKTVITSFVGNRETTPGLPKDHWAVASLDTDDEGMPEEVESTLVTVSSRDIDVVLRGGNIASLEARTEEDKPKAIERAKLHDQKTEQSIKLRTAKRLNRAAETILMIQKAEDLQK